MTSNNTAAGLDLDSVEDIGSAEYELLNPKTGERTGAFITLAGPEHAERKRISMALIRRLRSKAAQTPNAVQDPEEDIEESRDMLVRVTLGWRGISRAGQPLVFSTAAARELYADEKSQWVVKQLMVAMNDQKLFIKA